MRIPEWTPALKPQPADLVEAIAQGRGGTLLNLDRALLWSEPLARGWNVFMKDVRTGLPTSRRGAVPMPDRPRLPIQGVASCSHAGMRWGTRPVQATSTQSRSDPKQVLRPTRPGA